jgi:hypothetical protein
VLVLLKLLLWLILMLKLLLTDVIAVADGIEYVDAVII